VGHSRVGGRAGAFMGSHSRCGSGLSGEELSDQGHIWVGLDISKDMIGLLAYVSYSVSVRLLVFYSSF
jgi:hypothetical protein